MEIKGEDIKPFTHNHSNTGYVECLKACCERTCNDRGLKRGCNWGTSLVNRNQQPLFIQVIMPFSQ